MSAIPAFDWNASFFGLANRCLLSKGEIEPIQVKVVYKVGGRRGRTEITGFEPFLVIDGEEMADRMRKICAGSTSSKLVPVASLITGLTVCSILIIFPPHSM